MGRLPAGNFAFGNFFEQAYRTVRLVEAGHGGEMRAPGLGKSLAQFQINLFQRLDAVRNKARRDDGNLFHAVACQRLNGFVGIRLQPFCRAEARLESCLLYTSPSPRDATL